ncbi:hypothetical protein [Streptomyces sp. IB2014 016-6]|uniref:hypothetical protein n=1 Tax=Streptomyces sp. IB2014 016-6 TaxID=2517818 RepID=UPI0011CC4FF8|nr:hypothetical protein [Streptomyces sp. IB2014 016-6]TXL83945.1 hypothetical protein EW053_35870 [Streptomyces sp. IB2014 016-6]
MARIRTIKPEAFESESLAECSVTATLTFFGLLTLADDTGRFRDHPAIIAGRLWALRAEHTPAHVARDLEELAAAGVICRYTGCDGRSYLHIVTWQRHQKIDRPSASRVPRCTGHQAEQKCGSCADGPCPTTRSDQVSTSPRRGLDHPVSPDSPSVPTRTAATAADKVSRVRPSSGTVSAHGEVAGQGRVVEGSAHPREGSSSGSRILDPGSVPRGREAPAPDTPPVTVSAKELVAEYVSGCARRPPEDFLAHLGRKIRVLLEERFEPETVRAALERLRAKGLHPSVLPSLVNEILNASPQHGTLAHASASGAGPWASTTPGYTPYLNPATPEPTTFGGSL